jgi:hypothetical protein
VDVNTVIDENNLIVPGTVYGFDGSYFEAETIEPGYGYWVRSSGDGEITLSSSAPLTKYRLFQTPKHLNALTLNNTSLYFGNEIEVENPLSYSLPPKPPIGGNDIRFSGNTKLCTSDECVVKVTNNGKPLTIKCEIKDGESWEFVPVIASETKWSEAILLTSENQITLDSYAEKWLLRKSTSSKVPTEFALLPAHPNPFNPITTISFDIPKYSLVDLAIYNVLSQKIIQLVNEEVAPGFHKVKWKSENNPSGIYFIRMVAGESSFSEKIILLK